MSQVPVTIPKQPVLKPAEDYYRLRREGIGFIEQLGSSLWTDYNTHDPGITILEALCYALTDLAYRTGWNIQDILAPAELSPDPRHPFPDQPFFTAREILTVNPWTPDDFRRLLIDLDMVRNAWIICKTCACDLFYYAWCEAGELHLSFRKPTDSTLLWQKVEPLGLYEVLLELEADPELGDLNDRKIEHRFTDVVDPDGKPHPVIMELRFPDWGLEKWPEWNLWLDPTVSFTFSMSGFGATKTFNLLDEPNEAQRDKYVRDHWNLVFYVSFDVIFAGGENLTIAQAALRLFGDSFAKNQTTFADLTAKLEDDTMAGFLLPYRKKIIQVEDAVTGAKQTLRRHRNLDEDYCRVGVVQVEDVAACADVEVAPDADIEWVQARIWFELEQYFNPPVPFYSLAELMVDGVPVEEIFNGPELNHGFIKAADLAAAGLKTVLRTSDIINRLMDIDSVLAVNNLMLSKYDAEGQVIKGAADPAWVNDNPLFDPDKISAAWLLYITAGHQPRLYLNQSRFLFFINGLPFLPRMDEAADTLTQLRGEAERPKIKNADNDLTIPAGAFRNPEDYFPLQNGFPLTYGIGPEGLPTQATNERRAQARQLKAYLMVFEQLLGNALAQLAHTADLFSLDPELKRTYFVREFTEALIQDYTAIANDLKVADLEAMTETLPEFYERRNRFLDHIMARFGEQFTEYALLLTDLQGQQVAQERLIEDKISFLKAYPAASEADSSLPPGYPSISHDRARAFNDREHLCAPDNISGLKKRLSMLLGYPDLIFMAEAIADLGGNQYTVTFLLQDRNEKVWLTGEITITAAGPGQVKALAFREILRQLIQPEAYKIASEDSQFRLKLLDNLGATLGQYPELFPTAALAQAMQNELLSWSANERAIVVEHLLLRPKFPGDALYPACVEGVCKTCGDEDPYSFRLTLVMPGWTAPFNTNLTMRDFAERTIFQETPSHLLPKVCWVGNDGYVEDPCAPVISELAALLETQGLTGDGERPTETEACTCAAAIHAIYSAVFEDWYQDKTLVYFQTQALKTALVKEFSDKVSFTGIDCPIVLDAALQDAIQALLVAHFHFIALYGWQFERFETAWCQWLEANAEFDWTAERLQERVTAILVSNVKSAAETITSIPEVLCKCAADIVMKYGMDFYHWLEAKFLEGKTLEDPPDFSPDKVTLCPGFIFETGTAEKIEELLQNRYQAYTLVSYRLWILVNLLSQLRSTYPVATLHDCDAGSDQNPVLLGKTALGS